MSKPKVRMDDDIVSANCGLALTTVSLGSAFLLPGISDDETKMFIAFAAVGIVMVVVGVGRWLVKDKRK